MWPKQICLWQVAEFCLDLTQKIQLISFWSTEKQKIVCLSRNFSNCMWHLDAYKSALVPNIGQKQFNIDHIQRGWEDASLPYPPLKLNNYLQKDVHSHGLKLKSEDIRLLSLLRHRYWSSFFQNLKHELPIYKIESLPLIKGH